MPDRTATPCSNRPNCVSTQDERDKFNLAPFILRPGVTIEQVERIALSLSGAVTAEKMPSMSVSNAPPKYSASSMIWNSKSSKITYGFALNRGLATVILE